MLAPIVGFLYRNRVTKEVRIQERETIQAQIKDIQTRIEEKTREKNEVSSELIAESITLEQSTKERTDIYKPEITKHEERLHGEVLPICTSIAQATKKAMLETSLGVITEADWANIDLLIFYLETGRADSLKEALQLVDKQRQTEQITYAIHEASQHITNTLSARLNSLGAIIQTGFAQLGRQIQYNHNETMNTMLTSFGNLENTISSGNREISQQLGNLSDTMKAEGRKIAEAEHLNASLLKKANESSDQLMYELRYNQKYWKK